MLKFSDMDQEMIKESNRKKILNLLIKKREMTKQDISRETGISIPTVTNNIHELIEEGIVEEAGVTDSNGGRRPMVIRFLPDARYSIGIDFSLENIRMILTNLDMEIKHEASLSIDSLDNIDEIFSQISKLIQTALNQCRISADSVQGIGFSLHGTVNEEKMVLELAPNLGIKDIHFNRFSDFTDIPVYIENEANASAIAELTLGIAKQMRNLVYVSVTEGIGAGIVIQDHLYKGKNKRAGEFGHMTVVADGANCTCGKKGCWELYASVKALLQDFNRKTKAGVRSLKEFMALVKSGNEMAVEIWERYLNFLAIGIQNIILVLDPHYIIIGGEISQFEEELLIPLQKKVFIPNSFYGQDDTKIFLSKLKENSSIMGAALLPLQKLFYLDQKII